MKNIFQNKDVEHSFHCHSVSCLLNENKQNHRHVSVYHFDTATESFNAETLDGAAHLWIMHGAQPLVNVGRAG